MEMSVTEALWTNNLRLLVPLVVPTGVRPAKLRPVGTRMTCPNGGLMPRPVSDSVCGLLLALSTTVRAPLDEPVSVGENAKPILQIEFSLSVVEQVEV